MKKTSIFKVNILLEELHEKRKDVTKVYDAVVRKIDRRMKSLDATLLIDKYTNTIQSIKDSIDNISEYGEDIDECSEKIRVIKGCESGLIDVSEKCLKLVGECEALDNNLYGDVSTECNMHAYDSLQVCTDLLQITERKTEKINKYCEILEEFKSCMLQLREIEDNYTEGNCLSKEAFEVLHIFKNKVNHLLMETTSDVGITTAR